MANPNDERANAFGIPWRPPDRDQAVAQYLNRSMHKLRIAEWHLAEFERLEDELTLGDFFDFDREPFLSVQAHADGSLIQLAAAFDAFACAVAHRYDLPNADKADFGGWSEHLARSASAELGVALREIAGEDDYRGLELYRNLAAHRGVISELQRGSAGDEGSRDEVRLLLPDWLPEEFPDYPEASVRPILRRYLAWARPRIERLQHAAEQAWILEGEPVREQLQDELPDGPASTDASTMGEAEQTTNLTLPTEEERAPRFGDWRAWYSHGSHNFATGTTVPPAWYLRRGNEEPCAKSAVGLQVEELRAWLESLAGSEIAKAVLREYRPREMRGTNLGDLLIPSFRR